MTPMTSFADELLKIAGKVGFIKGVARNMKGAVRDLASPIKSLKREARKIPSDIKKRRIGNITNHAINTVATGLAVSPAISKRDPSGKGESRARRISRMVGGTLGGFATGSRGLSGSLLGGAVGERAGSLVGSAIDRLHSARKGNGK